MHQDPTSSRSETYKLKIAIFENGKIEESLNMVKNFKTAINGTGNTSADRKINYLRTLLSGKSLQ